ncbi:MAG: HAMP domain-containing histidine kinase [Oscillospiraceae bacterium]|nr:HAMP domain-containing histidine kinase [Oscillospiraceae bacterium]
MHEQLRQLISSTGQPALVAGADLSILEANESAKKLLPSLAFRQGLQVVFPSCNLAACIRRLAEGSSVTLTDPLLPGLSLRLIPFGCGSSLAVLGWLDPTEEEQAPRSQDPTQAMAAFSHAYRQPLSDLFGMTEVVANHLHANMDDSCDVYLDNINLDCYQMLRSFSNLTELYKYHSGVYDQQPEDPVDIWELTRSLCQSAAMMTRSKGISLSFVLPELPTPVQCSQERFATVLSNLISNCCQFTREGNSIQITGQVRGGNAVITIADRGTGIPEGYQGRVFEPFFSYDPGGAPFAGLGIGLALAQSFAQSVGGSLALQSRELEGTVVSLSLPIYGGDHLPIACYDAAGLLSNRFSPLNVVLGTICRTK